jgi:hypothetical protein
MRSADQTRKGECGIKFILPALTLSAALFSGCANSSKRTLQNQLAEIEQAHQAGKITTAEYLNLKQNAENAYQQRRAKIIAAP